jgi:hypothetical protein
MGSGFSLPKEVHDVPEIADLEEFDRISTAAPNPQLGGGPRKRNYTVKSKSKRRQTRRQK